MILSMLAVPFAAALVVWLFRHLRSLAASLATLAALMVAFLALYGIDTPPFVVLGRTLALDATTRVHLAIAMGMLAIVLASTARLEERDVTWSLALLGTGLLQAFLAIQNLTLAALILQASLVVLVMVIPLRAGDPALINMRALIVLVMAGALLAAAAWLIEHPSGEGAPAYAGSIALVAGLGMVLGVFPFFAWKLPIYRSGSSIARALFGVALPHLLLVRLLGLQGSVLALAGDALPVLLLNIGIATFVVGCVGALAQQTVSGILGYMAMGELGFVLMAMGSGTPEAQALAVMHLLYRGMAVVSMSVGIGILQHSFASDRLMDLRGAIRRAPLASVGILLAGFSLAGFPPSAGFVTRFALLRAIAVENLGWAVALMAIGFAPAGAMARYAVAAFQAAPVPASRREPLWPAALVLVLGLATLALGLIPQAPGYLAADWAELLYGLAGTRP